MAQPTPVPPAAESGISSQEWAAKHGQHDTWHDGGDDGGGEGGGGEGEGGPTITSISPDTANVDEPSINLTVIGTGFDDSSHVFIGDVDFYGILMTPTELYVPSVIVSTIGAGTHDVQVRNGRINPIVSNTVPLTLTPGAPAPTLTSVTPDILVQFATTQLVLIGTGFVIGNTTVTARTVSGAIFGIGTLTVVSDTEIHTQWDSSGGDMNASGTHEISVATINGTKQSNWLPLTMP